MRHVSVRLSGDLGHEPELHIVNRIAQNRPLYLHPAASLRENRYLARPRRAFKRHRRFLARRRRRIVAARNDMGVPSPHDYPWTRKPGPRGGVALVLRLATALRLPVEQPRVSLPQCRHLPPLRVARAVAGRAAVPHIIARIAFNRAAVAGHRADHHAYIWAARNASAALASLKIDVYRPLDLEIVAWPYSATRPQQPQSLRR